MNLPLFKSAAIGNSKLVYTLYDNSFIHWHTVCLYHVTINTVFYHKGTDEIRRSALHHPQEKYSQISKAKKC